MIVLFKTYHNYGQRLILNLTIAAFLNTAPYGVPPSVAEPAARSLTQPPQVLYGPSERLFWVHRPGLYCASAVVGGRARVAQSPVLTRPGGGLQITWFNWNVLVWVLCITHKLGLNILREDAGERWEWTYHLCGWGIGLVFAIIPLAMDMYGPSGVWCWVKDNEDATTALRFGIWCTCLHSAFVAHCVGVLNTACRVDVPLWIGIVILSVANFSIIRNVRKRERRWEGCVSKISRHLPAPTTHFRYLN